MSLQQVSVDRVPPQPWRNGGGVTRELWAWPAAAHWQLRVSVADIAQDGPFSAYPGVDRWFAVLQGQGVVLRFPQGEQVLGPDDDPLGFDGALAPGCWLRDGPTRDLNLMAQRDAGRSRMLRVRPGDEQVVRGPLCALFTAEALLLQVDDAAALELPAGTLAVDPQAPARRWRVRLPAAGRPVATHGPLRAWWLLFEPGART
jgi:environmental stress-induced protein Ves